MSDEGEVRSVSERAGPKRAIMFTVLPQFVELSEALLRERGHKLVGIVTAPGPRSRRSEEYREVAQLARPDLDVIISNYPSRWADMIRPLKPDLILCAGFNWRIPADVLSVPPLGAYNGHDSLLPKNRGKNATGWALRTGEPVYGVTFHRMTPEFDDGPILSQRAVLIAEDDDIDTLRTRFINAVTEAHIEALDRILAGYPGLQQDESQVTYSPGAFETEWREIDWNKPARDVHFQVRSWCGIRGVPRGAYGLIDGRRSLVIKTQLIKNHPVTTNRTPGTVLSQENGSIVIQCADGPLRLVSWEEALPVDGIGAPA